MSLNTGSPSRREHDRVPPNRTPARAQAGATGVAERPVVPMKPANPGGGKEPQLKANARSDEGPSEIGDEPSTSRKGSEVADGVTRQSEGIARLPLLRPVRQGVPQGRSASRLRLLPCQQRRGGRG